MLITIKDSSATAVIDSIGAQLISYKDSTGQEYIWQRDPQFWSRSSPLLFPIVGNLRNDKTIIENQEYTIPKHGFCRDVDFTVTTSEEHCAVFEMNDTDETKSMYPYSFRLSLTYELKNGSLSITYDVTNTDKKKIFYCLGAHPGFNCPLKDGECFEDYILSFEKEETAARILYDVTELQFDLSHTVVQLDHSRIIPVTRELFRDDAVYFNSLSSKQVSLVHKTTGKGIQFSYSDFDTIAFWSPYPAEAPFVCIEPWNGSAVCAGEDNKFEHKNHIQSLEVGQSKTYKLSMEIIL